jgi:hypothetical protein
MLERRGFFDRMGRGFGDFVTPQEIARRPPVDARDLFRGVPSVRVRDVRSGGGLLFGEAVAMSRNRNPIVYIDGVLVWPRTRASSGCGPPFPIENYIDVAAIQAVEIYDGVSEAPAQFSALGASCGIIVIWTR